MSKCLSAIAALRLHCLQSAPESLRGSIIPRVPDHALLARSGSRTIALPLHAVLAVPCVSRLACHLPT